jgi:maltooligosyltrehalose trehalohydrolase
MKRTVNRRILGINFSPGGIAEALVWAPWAGSVSVAFEWRGTLPMTPLPGGYWHAACPGVRHGDRYHFLLDGRTSLPDPASLWQPEGVHGPSACFDLGRLHRLHLDNWKGIPSDRLILYELHVGVSSAEGTFAGLDKRLDHLADLGVTMIELMPVGQFPGRRNWGYDGVFPFAVQNTYGGAEELAKLVAACHRRGMGVMLDVVYNHLGPEGNVLPQFGPWHARGKGTPWGRAINFDGPSSEGVRRYYLENALMWLRDFDMDGLRLDAVHAIRDHGPLHFLQELRQEADRLSEKTGRDYLLVAETAAPGMHYALPPGEGGMGLDAIWYDDFHHAVHALLTGERHGYYRDYGSMDRLVQVAGKATCPIAEEPVPGKTVPLSVPARRVVVSLQNHDQVGNRPGGERLTALLPFEALKLAAGLLLLSPFTPLLFMGEEYGEEKPFLFFTDYSDPLVTDRMQKGRRREMSGPGRAGKAPDPQSAESFLRSIPDPSAGKEGRKRPLFSWYRELIRLRKRYLLPGRQSWKAGQGSFHASLLMSWHAEGHHLLAAANCSEEPGLVRLPPDMALPRLLLFSAHARWGGPQKDGLSPLGQDASGKPCLHLPGQTFVLMLAGPEGGLPGNSGIF